MGTSSTTNKLLIEVKRPLPIRKGDNIEPVIIVANHMSLFVGGVKGQR